LFDGIDSFANPGDPIGLACRAYRTSAGYAPALSLEQIQEAIAGA
jgi:hypothetical protein